MKRNLPVKQFNEIKKTFQVKNCDGIDLAVDHESVYEWLGLKSPVNQWIRKAISKYKFIDGVDFIKIESSKSTVGRDNQNGFVENINNLQTKTVKYYCSKDMVKSLAMVASSDKGSLVRKYFLDCEVVAHKLLAQKEERSKLTLEYKPMTKAIQEFHEEPKSYHYSNEADMINRIVLGCSAAKFKAHNDIGQNESVRDYMTHLQMEAVVSLQRANTFMLEMQEPYEERKDKLIKLFNFKHSEKLIEEVHLINA